MMVVAAIAILVSFSVLIWRSMPHGFFSLNTLLIYCCISNGIADGHLCCDDCEVQP